MRVVVVASSAWDQSGIAALLEGISGVDVAGMTVHAEALEEVARLDPEVVLVQIMAADDAGLLLIEALADEHPGAATVALLEAGGAEDALLAGAAAVATPNITGGRLGAILEAVSRGLVVVPRSELDAMLRPEPAPQPAELVPEKLTKRELEVLQMLARGNTNAEIAALLGISAHTAKFHVGAVLAKLQARSRAEAVARASRLGLIVV